MTKITMTAMIVLLTCTVATAQAATDEEKCLAGRAKAKGKYEQCVENTLFKNYGSAVFDSATVSTKLAKCRIKYAATWTKLQKKLADSTTCVQARFIDNANGTVTDNLTGLVWEKKSDNGDIHDRDTGYAWSTGAPWNGNGSVYTTFLRTGLNTSGFAGANDWRLPTFAELGTILLPEPYPCAQAPCVDPIFNNGCVANCTVTTCSCTGTVYLSATTRADDSSDVWALSFSGHPQARVYQQWKQGNTFKARAVRGGL